MPCYDDLGRLTLAEERTSGGGLLHSYAYSYDANSNRTSQTVDGVTTSYSHNAADQLTQAGSTSLSYDANGNETGRSDGRAAAYNAKDQTTSMTPPGGSAISMSYTGTGQFKRVSAGGTTFQSNALGLGRETTGGASTTYIRDEDGQLLEQRTATGDHYYLFDGLDSVIAITDTSGNVAATYKYDPFGKLISSTGNVANPWRWLGGVGIYSDVATGLYKIGTRYYDPGLGRFIQADPVAGGGANIYDYADQDPINMIDLDGQVSRPCLKCVAAKVAKAIASKVGSAVRASLGASGRVLSWTWRTGKAVVLLAGRNVRIAIKACPWPMCRWVVRIVARYGAFTAALAAQCGLGIYGVYRQVRSGNWSAAAVTAGFAAIPCGLLVAAASPK